MDYTYKTHYNDIVKVSEYHEMLVAQCKDSKQAVKIVNLINDKYKNLNDNLKYRIIHELMKTISPEEKEKKINLLILES